MARLWLEPRGPGRIRVEGLKLAGSGWHPGLVVPCGGLGHGAQVQICPFNPLPCQVGPGCQWPESQRCLQRRLARGCGWPLAPAHLPALCLSSSKTCRLLLSSCSRIAFSC